MKPTLNPVATKVTEAEWWVMYEDATTPTTLKSPLTVSNVAIEIVIPTNAISISFVCEWGKMRMAKTATALTAKPYFIYPAWSSENSLNLSETSSIFVLRDSVDVTLSFYFKTLES